MAAKPWDGKSKRVLTEIPQDKELLVLTFGLASLKRITEADQQWLVRRISEMHDFLYDTPVFKEIMRYGREEERQEQVLELRETLLDIILELFPKIRIAAREQVDAITDTQILRKLIVKMHTFKTSEEALQYLRDINASEEKR